MICITSTLCKNLSENKGITTPKANQVYHLCFVLYYIYMIIVRLLCLIRGYANNHVNMLTPRSRQQIETKYVLRHMRERGRACCAAETKEQREERLRARRSRDRL